MYRILPLLVALGVKFDINTNHLSNCKIVDMDFEDNKIYLEHEYYSDLKNLIKDSIRVSIKISDIKELQLNIEENICNIKVRNKLWLD